MIITFNFAFAQNNNVELKVYPIDESKIDSSLTVFLDSLKYITISKDTARLYMMLDKDIVTSAGGMLIGKQAFIERWALTKPDSSDLWIVLTELIKLGGVFDTFENKKYFVLPYANANKLIYPIMQKYQIDIDPYSTTVCTNKNVPVFERPDLKSAIIGRLTYDIVFSDYVKTQEHNKNYVTGIYWDYISTYDNKTKGWVNSDDFYLYGSLRLNIEKMNSEWKIVSFLPFD